MKKVIEFLNGEIVIQGMIIASEKQRQKDIEFGIKVGAPFDDADPDFINELNSAVKILSEYTGEFLKPINKIVMKKTGDTVIFFPEGKICSASNNHSLIAPAIIVSRPWGARNDSALNLTVFLDGGGGTPIMLSKTSTNKATSLKQALEVGNLYATVEECQNWGVNLSDGYQDLQKLVDDGEKSKPDIKEEEQPSDQV